MPSAQNSAVISAMMVGIIIMAGAAGLAIIKKIRRTRAGFRPRVEVVAVMSVIWFFDTLGIGAVAPSTAYYKLRKLVPVHLIPSTMFVSAVPLCAIQGGMYIQLVPVDTNLLVCCVIAAVAGALFGSKVVESISHDRIRSVMGAGLLFAGCIMLLGNLSLLPLGGTALALPPAKFALAVLACFVFASLLNVGVGIFAPVMIVMTLLGLEPRAVFPILAASCAFLVPATALRVLRKREIDMRLVTSTAIGALPAVMVAAFVVKSMPLDLLRWVVMLIVFYASSTMLVGLKRRPIDESATPVAT